MVSICYKKEHYEKDFEKTCQSTKQIVFSTEYIDTSLFFVD